MRGTVDVSAIAIDTSAKPSAWTLSDAANPLAASMVKRPSAAVVAEPSDRPADSSDTFAPATGAPEASVTRPAMPAGDCAAAPAAGVKNSMNARRNSENRGM